MQKGSIHIIALVVGVGVLVGGAWFFAQPDTPAQSAVTTATDTSAPETALAEVESEIAVVSDPAAPVEEKAMSDTATDAMEQMEKAEDANVEVTSAPEPTPVPVVVEEPAAAPQTVGTFGPYDESKMALAADGDVVLFFHAAWCPSCRNLESNINARLDDIPADVHILKLDYDTETALKQKYGVVRQHTLVQVDASGNKVKTLTGLTNTLDQVLSQI